MKAASMRSWAQGALFTGGHQEHTHTPIRQSHKREQDKVGICKISQQAILIVLKSHDFKIRTATFNDRKLESTPPPPPMVRTACSQHQGFQLQRKAQAAREHSQAVAEVQRGH